MKLINPKKELGKVILVEESPNQFLRKSQNKSAEK